MLYFEIKNMEDWLISKDKYKIIQENEKNQHKKIRFYKEKCKFGYRLYLEKTGTQNIYLYREWVGNVDSEKRLILLWTKNNYFIWSLKDYKTVILTYSYPSLFDSGILSYDEVREYIQMNHKELIKNVKEISGSTNSIKFSARLCYMENMMPQKYPELCIPFNQEADKLQLIYHTKDTSFIDLVSLEEICKWGYEKPTPDLTESFILNAKNELKNQLVFFKEIQQNLLMCYATETKLDILQKHIYSCLQGYDVEKVKIVYKNHNGDNRICDIWGSDIIRFCLNREDSIFYRNYFSCDIEMTHIKWEDIERIYCSDGIRCLYFKK